MEIGLLIKCSSHIKIQDGHNLQMPAAIDYWVLQKNCKNLYSLDDIGVKSNMFWYSPGAKMGTWKCLRVQGFMIDPESIGVLKEIKLGCHDGNLGELFLFA